MVASEIGTLADQSAVYVKEITEVVRSVKNAFENLADNSRDILEFVDGRVRKDYELLVDTGSNYEKDAVYVSGFSEDTAAMAEELNASTEEISGVIQTISANIEDTSLSFEEISKNMNETIIAMNQIANAAENQAMVADLCQAGQRPRYQGNRGRLLQGVATRQVCWRHPRAEERCQARRL